LYLLQNIWFHAANLFMADKGRWKFFREKWNVELARADVKLRALRYAMKRSNGSGAPNQYPHLTVTRLNDHAALQYVPKPYPGRAVLIRPKRNFLGLNDPSYGWGNVIGERLQVCSVPIFPKGLMVEPFVENLALELKACLKDTR
jgi:hypothetical protein